MLEKFKNHQLVFFQPRHFVPRLNKEEIIKVADDICQRLQHTKNKAYFMIPKGGVGRYSYKGGVLEDKASDAENPEFVKEAVDLLIELIEDSSRGLN